MHGITFMFNKVKRNKTMCMSYGVLCRLKMDRRQHNIEFDGLILSNYRVIRTVGSFVKDMRRGDFITKSILLSHKVCIQMLHSVQTKNLEPLTKVLATSLYHVSDADLSFITVITRNLYETVVLYHFRSYSHQLLWLFFYRYQTILSCIIYIKQHYRYN